MNIRPRNPLFAARSSGSSSINRTAPSGSNMVPKRTEVNAGRRFASVTVSTMEEEEAEAEEKEASNSYEVNANIIRRELERQELLKKRKLDG